MKMRGGGGGGGGGGCKSDIDDDFVDLEYEVDP